MDPVLTSLSDSVLTITLNRPERYNAMTSNLIQALADACSDAVRAKARAVIVTGSGRGFCSGADLMASQEAIEPPSRRLRTRYLPTIMQLATLPMPVIAAVNGATAGSGLSIAGAADIRIAAETAFFAPGFVDVGLSPDTGASYFLTRAMGYSSTFAFLCSGERMDARAALASGLVNEVVPLDSLLSRATELATKMAGKPGRGVEFTKHLLQTAQQNSLAQQIESEVWAYDIASVDEGRVAARKAQAAKIVKTNN